ncbi:MAG: MFS transporter [Promethearchaeota archaeon]
MSETEKIPKFNAKQTLFIGLAFFTSEIAWALYNAQVPLMLQSYVSLLGMIGLFMALDNIIGVIIQPIMGSISDNTRTKYGRRMPYLMIGVPLGALFFALIPTQTSFLMLILWMFFFGLSMGFYRAQAVSLMPDFVKPVNRSKGNAIINFMGGIGVAIGYGFSFLLDLFTDRTLGLQTLFIIVSFIMVGALVVLLVKIKEKDSYGYQLVLEMEEKEGKKIKEKKKKPSLIESIKDILAEDDKSTLFILFAIFFWFVGYQGVVALVSIYGVDVLGYSPGLAGFLPFIVTIPLLISIYPLSIVAMKIGRRKAIKIGVIAWIAMLILGTFLGIAQTSLVIMAIPLAVLGLGWALINVNSIVIVWELAPTHDKIGTYTGLYYFFSYMAAILGPMIVGFITDLTGLEFLLLNASFFFIAALICIFLVKRGEVELTEEEKYERQKILQEL